MTREGGGNARRFLDLVAHAGGLIVDTTRSVVGINADGTQVTLLPPEWQFRYLEPAHPRRLGAQAVTFGAVHNDSTRAHSSSTNGGGTRSGSTSCATFASEVTTAFA